VPDIFKALKDEVSCPTILAFYDYIENNYIGKRVETARGRGQSKRIQVTFEEPLFPMHLWSVISRINEKNPSHQRFC
jgi:hypothetical protein